MKKKTTKKKAGTRTTKAASSGQLVPKAPGQAPVLPRNTYILHLEILDNPEAATRGSNSK